MADLSDAAPPERNRQRSWLRPRWWWPVTAGALVGIALRLVYAGKPGGPFTPMMGSFSLLAPMVVGAVAVYVAELTARRSWNYYFGIAAAANVLFVLGTLAIVVEGLICAILIVAFFALLGGVAGLLMGAVCRWTNWPQRALCSFAALPLLLGGVEQRLPLPQDIRTVTRVLTIDAAPADVWAQLVDAPSIRAEEIGGAWMYRIGVPLPESAVTEMRPDGAVRHIRMGKGIHFDQVAAVWNPEKRVRWLYRFSPNSFPPRTLDDHVRIGGDYFDLIDTEYVLEPTPNGTVLRASMSYRVSTRFNWYARPLAALLVGNFEEAALSFYAQRAQAAARARFAGSDIDTARYPETFQRDQ